MPRIEPTATEDTTTEEKIASDPSAEVNEATPLRRLFRWHFVVLLAIMVFVGAIRWRLLDMPLERDEGEYAYAGQLILQGIPPYQLAYNMKLPGTYAAYAAILAVFGETTGETARGIHLGLLLINAISIILLYVVTARLFGARAGTVAGASYALLSTNLAVFGFAAHATHFVVLPALIGLILLLHAEETRRPTFFFWSGLAFGIAFLMKQPGIFLGAFALFYLAVQCWPKNKREWTPWAKNLAIFLLAGVLPDNFSDILRFTKWLWGLALVGVFATLWDPTVRRHAVFVFGLLLFSFAAVCPGLYFRHHYFVLMLPAIAILIAVAVTSTTRWLTTKFTSRWLHVLPVIVFAAACALTIYRNAEYYFKLTPVQACRFSYN